MTPSIGYCADYTFVMLLCNTCSIQYGIGILHAIQNESKSLKKSLKVINRFSLEDTTKSLFTCINFLKHGALKSHQISFLGRFHVLITIVIFLDNQDVMTENEFEKRLLTDVIPPNDIGVTFDDIGALENVKDTLKELVMLPLQRPELFCRGQLTKVSAYLCIQ